MVLKQIRFFKGYAFYPNFLWQVSTKVGFLIRGFLFFCLFWEYTTSSTFTIRN